MPTLVQPLVSIIIPVFNIDKYLRECLNSVLRQTYRQLQVIIIDDGSTDNSGLISDDYSKRDSRVTVIHQKNRGVSAARNAGLDIATGEFLAFIDGDDWVDDTWIETQLETIKKWNADIAVCGCELVYKNARRREDNSLPHNYIENYADKKNLLLMQREWKKSAYAQGHTQKKLIRRECLIDKETNKKIRFITDRNYNEDELFTLQIYKNANKVAFNNKAVFYYRMRSSSAVSEQMFAFRTLRTRVFLHNENFISDKDLLKSYLSALWQIYPINPGKLSCEDSNVYYDTLKHCQNISHALLREEESPVKKFFILLLLSKWIPSFLSRNLYFFVFFVRHCMKRQDNMLGGKYD